MRPREFLDRSWRGEGGRVVRHFFIGRFFARRRRHTRLSCDWSSDVCSSDLSEDELRGVDKIILVGCGTAFYAGMVAKYAIEHWTRIPCEGELAHEFRYRDPILPRDTLVVAISQSGETADTLMAIRHAREQRSKVLAICNTNGS